MRKNRSFDPVLVHLKRTAKKLDFDPPLSGLKLFSPQWL